MKKRDHRFSLIAPAALWDLLQLHLKERNAERMAFGYCSASSCTRGIRLLLRGLALPSDHEYAVQHQSAVVLGAEATIPYLLRAKGVAAMLDAHSHPLGGAIGPSRVDDEAARHQLVSLQAVAPGGALLRIIASGDGHIWAAVHTSGSEPGQPLHDIRVYGPGGVQILRPVNAASAENLAPRAMDSRNLAVLGDESFAKTRRLNVAVIGLGGVGSTVARLVASLVGRLTLVNPDYLEPHNAPRLWYAGAATRGPKVSAAKRALRRSFPDLVVTGKVAAFPSAETVALVLQADFVFACPDHHAVRNAISRLCAAEMIPLVEVGCGGRKEDARLSSLGYHVRLQVPGGPCLACNGLDVSHLEDPDTTAEKRRAGYIENGGEVAGELACLTTRAAADAVDVFLRYYTGYAGPPPLHIYGDVLHLKTIDLSNAYSPRAGCPTCGDSSVMWSGKDSIRLLQPSGQSHAACDGLA